MPASPIELTVGGQAYRIHTDANPEKLRHLARIVDEQINDRATNTRLTPNQALLYAALSLAEQLDEQRNATHTLQTQNKLTLQNILQRIDTALLTTDPLIRDHRTTAKPTKLSAT